MKTKPFFIILILSILFSCNSNSQEQNNFENKDTINNSYTMTEQEQMVYNLIKEANSSGISDKSIFEKLNIPHNEIEKILFELEMEGLVSKTKAAYYDKIEGTIGVLIYNANK